MHPLPRIARHNARQFRIHSAAVTPAVRAEAKKLKDLKGQLDQPPDDLQRDQQ